MSTLLYLVFAFVVPGVANDEAKVTLTYSTSGKVSGSLVVDKNTGESTGVLKLNGVDGEMQVRALFYSFFIKYFF